MWAHSDSFENYKGGVLVDRTVYPSTTHDIALVGFGEEAGVPYWIGRNSFGTVWVCVAAHRHPRHINSNAPAPRFIDLKYFRTSQPPTRFIFVALPQRKLTCSRARRAGSVSSAGPTSLTWRNTVTGALLSSRRPAAQRCMSWPPRRFPVRVSHQLGTRNVINTPQTG